MKQCIYLKNSLTALSLCLMFLLTGCVALSAQKIQDLIGQGDTYLAGSALVEVDYRKALELYTEAAALGSSDAMTRIGIMHEEGLGGLPDPTAAMDLYLKAAKKGNADAMVRIALMHYHGEGMPQNLDETWKWLKKAADHGSTKAHDYLVEWF